MENEKEKSIKVRYENILRLVNHLYDKQLTLPDILKKVLFSIEDTDEFIVGIKSKEALYAISPNELKFQSISLKNGKKEEIKKAFQSMCENNRINFVEYFRCTLSWEIGGDDFTFYYYARITKRKKIDFYYLSEVEKEYYMYLCNILWNFLCLSHTIGEKIPSDLLLEKSLMKLPQNAYIRFVNTIEKHFGIDINLIVELSGHYYEGEACNSSLVFQISNVDIDKKLMLKDPIPLNKKNVRLIRKMLQSAGHGNQSLLVKKEAEGWKIVAICLRTNDKFTGCIQFSILGHMSWKMQIENNDCLWYKSGQLEVREDGYYLDLFKKKYITLYGENPDNNLIEIFKKICKQKHGTVMIVAENVNDNKELDPYQLKSSGIDIYRETDESELNNSKFIEKDFVDGITSIDGAIFVDRKANCYGMGYILNGALPLVGRPDRGARYNSTARYISNLKEYDKCAIAVIVSEDKTIDIISTNDDIKKEHEELNEQEM